MNTKRESGHGRTRIISVMTNHNETTNYERLLRKKEAAEILACSTRTIDREASSGRLTRVKVRGGVRFRLSQVQAVINGGVCD